MSDDWSDIAAPVEAKGTTDEWSDIATPAPESDNTDKNDRLLARTNRDAKEYAENAPDQVQRTLPRMEKDRAENDWPGRKVPKTFTEGFTESFKDLDWKNNAVIRYGNYLQYRAQAQESLQAEWQKGHDDGTITEPLREWLTPERVDRRYKAEYTKLGAEEQDVNWGDMPENLYKAITENPGGFVGGFIVGAAVDPEVMWMPQLGLAKALAGAGKAAHAAARAVEGGVVMGTQGAGISAARQLEQTGEVKGKTAAQEGAQMAALGMTLAGATDLALAAAARKKGTTLDAETKARFDKEIKDNVAKKVAEGMDPIKAQTEAATELLEKVGFFKPKDSQKVKDAVDEQVEKTTGEPNAAETGEQPKGGVEEHQGTGEERAPTETGSGDRPVEQPPETPAEVKGEAPEVLAAREDYNKARLGLNTTLSKAGVPHDSWNAALDRALESHTDYKTPEGLAEAARLVREETNRWKERADEGERKSTREAMAKADADEALFNAKHGLEDVERTDETPLNPGDPMAPLEFEKVNIPGHEPTATGEAAAPAPSPKEPLPGNKWYHFTREPGTRNLSAAKAGKGNARGEGIYLSKVAEESHTKPRVDREGNLGPPTEGELLTTELPNEVADRMFDESRMFTREDAQGVFEGTGLLPDEAAALAKKTFGKKEQISGETLYKALKKEFGSADYASAQLKGQGYTGVKFKDAKGNDLAVVFHDLVAEPAAKWNPPFSALDRFSTRLGEIAETARVAVSARVRKIERLFGEGKDAQAKFEVEKLAQDIEARNLERQRNVPEDRVRGADWVRERLLRARRLGELDGHGVDLALWLLDKNPGLAEGLAISIRSKGAKHAAGQYVPLARLMKLITGRGDPLTTTHEILHHTERMMPEPVQAGIRKEWATRLANIESFAQGYDVAALRRAVGDVLRANMGDEKSYHQVVEGIQNGVLPPEFYQFVNASEFWAENASRILNNRAEVQGQWVGQARQWLSEFGEKVKGIFGLESDAPVLKGLKSVLSNEEGTFRSDRMLVEDRANTGLRTSQRDVFRRPDMPLDDFTTSRRNSQAGLADPKLLAMVGLASAAGLTAYALTGGDAWKAVAAAAGAGALVFAGKMAGRMTLGTTTILNHMNNLTRDRRHNSFETKEVFRAHPMQIAIANHVIRNWEKTTTALLTGDRTLMDKFQARVTGEAALKESFTRIRDYTQGYRDMNMSTRELMVADEIRKFTDRIGERAMDEGVLRNMIENYLPGLYEKTNPLTSWADIYDILVNNGAIGRTNFTGMSPRSRHNLHKVIPDYRTVDRLIADGTLKLKPLTDNPIAMVGQYGRSMNKTIANHKLINTLMREPGPNNWKDGIPMPLLMPIRDTVAANHVMQAMAMNERALGLRPDELHFVNRMAQISTHTDYTTVNHPALEGMKVHKDVVHSLKLMFDTNDPGAVMKAAYATSMAAKTMAFSLSLFHGASLLAVGALTLAPRVVQGVVTGAMHPRMVKQAYQMVRGPKLISSEHARATLLADQFPVPVRHAAEWQMPLASHAGDFNPDFMTRAINVSQHWISSVDNLVPGHVFTALSKTLEVPKWMNQAAHSLIFDTIRPTMKLATMMVEEAHWDRKHPTGTPAEKYKAMLEICQGINDLYGGINYFELANNVDTNVMRNLAVSIFSPQGRRVQQIIIAAPDWNIASLRAWTETAKTLSPWVERRASDALYRSYIFWGMATYLGLANYLQNKFTGQSIWETSDWSKIDMGDGRTLQLNKHLMEGPHFISDPRKFLIDKLGYAPKEGSLQFMGKEYLTTDKVTGDISGPPMDKSISGRLSHAARSFATPIAATTIHDPLALGAGMGGFPIHGSTFESRIEEAPNRVRSSAEQRADEAAKRAKLAGKDPEEARKRVLGNIERDVNRATDRARKKKEDAERDIARRNIVSGP